MADPTARVLELLAQLQVGGMRSAPELARRMGVTERTVRRDVQRLRELGYGVDAVQGAAGGYRLGAGAAVPPLVLAPDEAVAIAVGLRGAAIGAVGGLGEAALSALAKLEHSLSNEARERIAGLSQSMVGLGGASSVDLEAVVLVARAIRERRRLRIRYRRHDGSEVQREVEPHRIVHTAERWYLVAHVPEQHAWRTFRLDRLEPRLPLGAPFPERAIPDEATARFVGSAIATAPYPVRCRVVMRASLAQVRQRFGPQIVEAAERDDGTTLVVFGTDDLDASAVYLGSAGFDFTVLEPPELRDALERMGERMLAAARA
ncbi:WYL domain-containing protein [Agrococcus sp. ARC_14]|uniref:helix-turn-helix transcriptional regulator n=1 Tax=Agrococcus sp. ARC_14 TaxID=2919927 RepID=UPI001F05DA2B|nr:WYL domain-containing protein [Agrococcus sp. ARC_14]MCH1881854.1 WYL domain-containing protein [Agrococcus sp. ARC_14]